MTGLYISQTKFTKMNHAIDDNFSRIGWEVPRPKNAFSEKISHYVISILTVWSVQWGGSSLKHQDVGKFPNNIKLFLGKNYGSWFFKGGLKSLKSYRNRWRPISIYSIFFILVVISSCGFWIKLPDIRGLFSFSSFNSFNSFNSFKTSSVTFRLKL